MSSNKRYNGWANYETWAVKLWIDNEEGSYRYWRDATRRAWATARDKRPNQFMDKAENAQNILAEQLKDEHDSHSDHPVFKAAHGTVYSDLLNAALSEVEWREIAEALLESRAEDGELDEDDDTDDE